MSSQLYLFTEDEMNAIIADVVPMSKEDAKNALDDLDMKARMYMGSTMKHPDRNHGDDMFDFSKIQLVNLRDLIPTKDSDKN